MNIPRMATRIVSRYIREARLKTALRRKQMLSLMGRGNHFGMLSAYRGDASKTENKRRHADLIRDLQLMGHRRLEPAGGKWEGVSEKALLVPGMAPEDLFALGQKYKQDAVIYKSNKGVIGMYYFSPLHVVVAADPKGTPLYEISTDPKSELYSKARGLHFEFGFVWVDMPWNGKNPVSIGDIVRFFSAS